MRDALLPRGPTGPADANLTFADFARFAVSRPSAVRISHVGAVAPAVEHGNDRCGRCETPASRWSSLGRTSRRSPVIDHQIRVHPSADQLPREDQLAWKLASVATGTQEVGDLDPAAAAMAVNRVIDNASVAMASLRRRPVAVARAQAVGHTTLPGASVFGAEHGLRVSPEWAAWANGTAVRELDFHDTYLAADYSHPGDNIPPLLAVAQHTGRSGADLLRGIVAAYEIHVALRRSSASTVIVSFREPADVHSALHDQRPGPARGGGSGDEAWRTPSGGRDGRRRWAEARSGGRGRRSSRVPPAFHSRRQEPQVRTAAAESIPGIRPRRAPSRGSAS